MRVRVRVRVRVGPRDVKVKSMSNSALLRASWTEAKRRDTNSNLPPKTGTQIRKKM